jgi:cell division protease FtsH
LSKKGKIVMSTLLVLLAVAIAAILITTSLNGGAKKIDTTLFNTYVENAQYVNEDGTQKAGTTLPDGYYVSTEGELKGKVVQKVNDREVPINVIYRVQVDAYEYKGFDKTEKGKARWLCYGPSMYGADANEKLNEWASFGVTIDMSNPNSGSWVSTAFTVFSLVVVCLVFFLIIRSSMGGGGKMMSFAKTKARVTTNIKVRFTDVAGAEEEKVELAEIVEFLRQPKKFSDLGARIPKGVLLVGPPGTGKTLFAKAVAGEAGVPFFSVSGSDFVEMYVGVGASRVRDLFEMAKKNQPCIIFIDEIDAVGRHRGAGLGGGNDEREQTLNQILVQMDGFESNEGVIVMAATNRSDILDPALTRPGRFDRQVFVNLPDVRGREKILKVHARNKPFAPDVNFKTVARLTAGFSGADLANLLNEAAILAARANKKFITNAELFESIDKVEMGPAKKSKLVTESEKRLTAFHEAGHCILAKLCTNCDPVHEVTIIPRGNAGGFTMTRPEHDRAYYSKNFMLDDICMCLGGRVAEELVIKDISSGAMGDIKQATKFARLMVTELGMSDKLGLISYSDDSQPMFIGRDMATHNSYSEETAKMIDEEVRNIVSTQHERARKLLTENRSVLDNMARVLIERETIYADEVDMLMEGKTYAEVIKYLDDNEKIHSENPFKKYEKDEDSSSDGKTDETVNGDDVKSPATEAAENKENITKESKTDGENE